MIMISEGSCDIEDWSNDAENSALWHRNTFDYFRYFKSQKLLNIKKTIFSFFFINGAYF